MLRPVTKKFRRRQIGITVILLACLGYTAAALQIRDSLSPRSSQRPLRRRTYYIILHTTEGPSKGSLNKLKARGETHYFVDTDGVVHRVVDKRRIALHCGRSMWDRLKNLDQYTVGVEVVGYHNKDITPAQYRALKELVLQLQRIYRIPDQRVLTHSMVAYGAPNRWHRRSHRGRKRCGMLFALDSVRKKIGLSKRATYDPDVKAGRLSVADPYLAKVLYGSRKQQESAVTRYCGTGANVISASRSAWDIARDKYNSADTVYVLPGGKKVRGNQVKNWKKMPAGTKILLGKSQRDNPSETFKEIGKDGNTATEIAGDEFNKATTIYFMPGKKAKMGDQLKETEFKRLPKGTKMLVGYTAGGYITAKRSAFDICGKRWNFPSTYYLFPNGKLKSGSQVDENSIPKDSLIFFRN